jgi:RNA polymerase sigma-70 factor, ECF subfamily
MMQPLFFVKNIFLSTSLNLFNVCASNITNPPTTTLSTITTTIANDEEILALLRGGNKAFEQGFRMLMAKYRERLYWHIRRMVNAHNDADDVLQNTFIKVYRGIGQFEGKSALYTWLYRIATNEAITFLQQRNRRSTTSIDAGEVTLASRLKADEWFDGDQIQVRLQESIEQLPEKQKIVFNLRYFQEMPYEEMSTLLDTSVGALKASFHHAVKKIEAFLEQ